MRGGLDLADRRLVTVRPATQPNTDGHRDRKITQEMVSVNRCFAAIRRSYRSLYPTIHIERRFNLQKLNPSCEHELFDFAAHTSSQSPSYRAGTMTRRRPRPERKIAERGRRLFSRPDARPPRPIPLRSRRTPPRGRGPPPWPCKARGRRRNKVRPSPRRPAPRSLPKP
jgi:hypothetical protein